MGKVERAVPSKPAVAREGDSATKRALPSTSSSSSGALSGNSAAGSINTQFRRPPAEHNGKRGKKEVTHGNFGALITHPKGSGGSAGSRWKPSVWSRSFSVGYREHCPPRTLSHHCC